MFEEAADELRTVRDLLRFAVSRFLEAEIAYEQGTTEPLEEAEILVAHALHLPPAYLEHFRSARLTRSEREAALALVGRRIAERLPAAFITGEAWLGGLRFQVGPSVIIPRSFIAELIPEQIGLVLADAETPFVALDLCTGCGCLAILLANAFPDARVDATDISAEALHVARTNVEAHGLQGRVSLIESDLFAGLRGRRYDLILCNPPYVTDAALKDLPREFRHEPAVALAGGADGLHVVRKVLAEAAAHLAPGGALVMEIGRNRAALERTLPDLEFVWLNTSAGPDNVLLYRPG